MAKSRSFSIYLLKQNYDETNTLKDDHSLGTSVQAGNLPSGATLYLLDKTPKAPWWRSYWGINGKLQQAMKGAIVFLPVDNRCFALTFGHTYHNLKDESYEYDFGLRTTLNALDPEKIKSTDILQPENARRARIQMPNASGLTFFDINKDESIFKKLTGAVKKEYKKTLSNVTGASSLKISSKVPAKKMPGLCGALLEIYKKDDFKKSFPDIQNIVPVKDPAVIDQLNAELENAFNTDSIDLVLTIPELFDSSEGNTIKYSGAGKSKEIHEDIYIANYRDYLQERQVTQIDTDIFKKHYLNIEDENGYTKKSYTVYKSFLFEYKLNSDHYHLCEGNWYKIENNYIKKLKKELDPYFTDHSVLIECNEKLEKDFNSDFANTNNSYICLDAKNISPKYQTQVEPCDLYAVENNIAQLIHIKISTRSSTLSHLFNQGLNSVELLRLNNESQGKLTKLLNDPKYSKPITNNKYAVIYGIITAKDKTKKSDNLPIFSRISLMRTMNALKLMSIEGSVVLIKDNVNRK